MYRYILAGSVAEDSKDLPCSRTSRVRFLARGIHCFAAKLSLFERHAIDTNLFPVEQASYLLSSTLMTV